MRLVVDMTKCQSYAQCCFLAPDAFKFEGQEALVYDPQPDDSQRARIKQAAAACPVQAIHLDREDVHSDAPTNEPPYAGRSDVQHDTAPAPLDGDRHIVVVGASLAGLRAAEAVRREGFAGRLTLIGDEPVAPYDRPPLSKQVLSGMTPADHTDLPRLEALDAEWKLGVPATGLDLDGKQGATGRR